MLPAVTHTSDFSGPAVPPRQMSQPHRVKSATARPDLLLQSMEVHNLSKLIKIIKFQIHHRSME